MCERLICHNTLGWETSLLSSEEGISPTDERKSVVFVPSMIQLIKTLRTELDCSLSEAKRIADRIESEQVERAVEAGGSVPDPVMVSYGYRAARKANHAAMELRLASAVNVPNTNPYSDRADAI